MSKTSIVFGLGTMIAGACLSYFLGPKSAIIGFVVGIALMVFGYVARSEETADNQFFSGLRKFRVVSELDAPAENRPELLALRRLVGELSEEVGDYGPVRDLGSLRERLSQVERAAGTFGHDLALRQAIRDVHHTLVWIVSVKNNPERAPDDGTDLRGQLETHFQHFVTEINRLL